MIRLLICYVQMTAVEAQTALYFDTNGDALQDSVNDGQTFRQNILVGSCAV